MRHTSVCSCTGVHARGCCSCHGFLSMAELYHMHQLLHIAPALRARLLWAPLFWLMSPVVPEGLLICCLHSLTRCMVTVNCPFLWHPIISWQGGCSCDSLPVFCCRGLVPGPNQATCCALWQSRCKHARHP